MTEDKKTSDSLFSIIVAAGVLPGILYIGLSFLKETPPILAEIPLFVPMIHGFFVLETFTIAFLALGRHRALRDPASYWIGIAFASFSIANAFYVLAWPGLRADGQPLIGHLPGTASWIIVLAEIIFSVLIIVAVTVQWPAGRALDGQRRVWSVTGLLVLLVSVYVLLVLFEEKLPVMIGPKGTFMPLQMVLIGAISILYAAGAVFLTRYYKRFRDLLAGYVALDLICLFYGLIGFALAGKRYTVTWYTGRLLAVVGGAVVLLGLLWEYVGLYRKEQDKTCELEESIASRKLVEEALRENKAQLDLALLSAYMGTWYWDITEGKRYFDNQVCHLLGIDPMTFTGSEKEFFKTVHPGDLASIKMALSRTIEHDVPYEVEYRSVWPDGSIHYINARGTLVRNDAGRPARINGLIWDISERKRSEETLRENKEQLTAVFDGVSEILMLLDIEGNIIAANKLAAKRLGQGKTGFVGRNIYDLIPAHFHEPRKEQILEMIRTKKPVKFQDKLEDTFLEVTFYPVFDDQGNVIRFISFALDITTRNQAEAAILRAKKEWERTFNTIPDLIAILDKEHRVVRVNQAMAERLGLTPGQCIGASCYRVVHGLSHPPEFCPHTLTCRDGGEHVAEVHEAVLGGDFLVSTTPLCNDNDQVIGSIHVARNITQRKRMEEELRQKSNHLEAVNKELESFSYSVSHDLRAPLRAIDGFSRVILRQCGDKFDENTRRQFNLIRDNTRIMGVLIENLLSFSRLQKASMNISTIDMDKLASEVWKEIQTANKERDLELKITKILPGYGDHSLIRQVLSNLLDNAVKFTKNKKQGIVEISSYIEDGEVVYWMKDNGAGFDMAYYDKLFGVFQRLHSNEEYEGTGVGLAIVQRIVSRHGGRVWAEGKLDEGATFFFSLPSCAP